MDEAYILRNSHNRIARGMTRTIYRSGQSYSDDACRLSVKGTLDGLAGLWWLTRKSICPTCKCRTGGLELNVHGKRKLRRLNRRPMTRSTNRQTGSKK